jgi:two-component system, chemotaxis family, chemotaxis protein CheY
VAEVHEMTVKILVVDDDAVSRIKMQAILKAYGAVECAEGGADALRVFRKALDEQRPFDLISLDYSMPGMDGAEILRHIRSIEKLRRIDKVKVVMVTGMTDRDTVIDCRLTGCDDYVIKPFDRQTVTAKLTSLGFFEEAGNA